MLESLNRYFAAWLATLKTMFMPWVWGPFLVLAVIQGIVLWMLLIAPSPAFGGWPIALLRYWFGPMVGHYPAHLVATPYMFFRLSILVYGVFGVATYGVATAAFAKKFTGRWDSPESFVHVTIRKYFPLFVIWLVSTAVVFFALARFPDIFADWTFGSPRRGVLIDALSRVIVVAFMSLWAYTTVALVVEGAALLAAVKLSMRRFLRRPLATFFLLGIPYAITIPFSLIAAEAPDLVRQFRPETIIFALILVIISQFVANIITCGSVTHYYLSEPGRE